MKKPTIAIIGGTGKEGMGLAIRWAAAGYQIYIGSRFEDKAKQTAESLCDKLGITTVQGMENIKAAEKADICVLTVIHSAHLQTIEGIQSALHGKILIDATARVDFSNPKPPNPPSAAEQAQYLLGPQARVVAAFQNVPAKSLTKSIDQTLDADVLVCSNDVQAAEQVVQLVYDAGMRGIYAGILENSNVVEGLTSILIGMNKYYGTKNARIVITGIPL
jgi:hypothetical protein